MKLKHSYLYEIIFYFVKIYKRNNFFYMKKKIDLQAQEHTELQFVLPIGINVSFTLTLSNAAHKNFSNFF